MNPPNSPPNPLLNHARAAALCALLTLAATLAQAQMFKDSAFDALYAADKHAELQRLAQQRLSAQPDDTQAVLALGMAALALEDAGARTAAIARAQACVERLPQAAACHYALGSVLGVQAMAEGMVKAARSIGTIRGALTQAQALEPAWYPARSALVEFYLLAPGMLGGSSSKAAEIARAAPVPEQVRALEARIAMQDEKFDAALPALTALVGSTDSALAEDVRAWGTQSGLALVNAGEAAKAQPFFERLQRERPGHASGAYGLARVRAEAGAPADAVALYEKAAALKGAQQWPIDYQLGVLLQQLGRADVARAAFNRFVAAGKGRKSMLEDARKRLAQLAG